MQADRIYVYGSQRYDEDTRVSSTMSMQQGAIQAYTDLQAATSWIRPEVLAVGKPTIDKYIAEQPKLQELPSSPCRHVRSRVEHCLNGGRFTCPMLHRSSTMSLPTRLPSIARWATVRKSRYPCCAMSRRSVC